MLKCWEAGEIGIAAGNFFFDDAGCLIKVSHKSGDFRPAFSTLQSVFEVLITLTTHEESVCFDVADTLLIERSNDRGGVEARYAVPFDRDTRSVLAENMSDQRKDAICGIHENIQDKFIYRINKPRLIKLPEPPTSLTLLADIRNHNCAVLYEDEEGVKLGFQSPEGFKICLCSGISEFETYQEGVQFYPALQTQVQEFLQKQFNVVVNLGPQRKIRRRVDSSPHKPKPAAAIRRRAAGLFDQPVSKRRCSEPGSVQEPVRVEPLMNILQRSPRTFR